MFLNYWIVDARQGHGVAEKSALRARFLKRKMAEYEILKAEIEALSDELPEGMEKGADFR